MSGTAAVQAWGADEAVTHLYAAHYRSLVRLAALLLRDDRRPPRRSCRTPSWRCTAPGGGCDDPDRALAYLRRSVVNGARSALRHREVVERHAPGAAAGRARAPSTARWSPSSTPRCSPRCATLPERQREVLVLRYYVDLSEADIADALGISRGAVKSHASRGMAALRTTLEATA